MVGGIQIRQGVGEFCGSHRGRSSSDELGVHATMARLRLGLRMSGGEGSPWKPTDKDKKESSKEIVITAGRAGVLKP